MILWTGLAAFVAVLVVAGVIAFVRDRRVVRRTERRVSPERRRIDCEARKLLAPRGHLPHHCAGTDTCSHCAEMREAHRREEAFMPVAGASRAHTIARARHVDTTRTDW